MLPVYIDEVPKYEARDGLMFVRWRSLEITLPIPICERAVARCHKALDEWHAKKDHAVINFPGRDH